jgi:hypothetical protein
MNYDFFLFDPLSSISYLLLLLALCSLWIRQSFRIWGAVATISLICGFIANRINFLGVFSILTLGLLCHLFNKSDLRPAIRLIAAVLMIILSVSLAAHLIPGFNNWKVIDNAYLSEVSQPYSMYLNMDKSLVGLIILSFCVPLIRNLKDWIYAFRSIFTIFLVGLTALVIISSLFGCTQWDVKLPDIFIIWVFNTLFFTCFSEEAFFRGFLQRNLSEKLQKYAYGKRVSLMTIAVLFGLAHYPGGLKYIILASMAGIIYGFAYQKTGRIEASILCHFGVNTFHFIFLTYPVIA